MVSSGVLKETPKKKTPPITSPTTAPRGLGRPRIAVAVLLSLSPNHLLQTGVTALSMIGPGQERIVVPTMTGQKVDVKVVMLRIQAPTQIIIAPILSTVEILMWVYIQTVTNDIGMYVAVNTIAQEFTYVLLIP
jgi:Na+-translocating ferredoxin:NAD+ oxidoreductase RnfE subunit